MTKSQLIRVLEPYLKQTPKIPIRPKTAPPAAMSSENSKRSRYGDLPWSYGKTELVLMPVDPFLLYAYWDFSLKDWEKIQTRRNPVVLRIYDITTIRFDGKNAHHYFDVPVFLGAQHWYVPLWSAEKSFCADLGWLLQDGSFDSIIRSNVVQTPRAGVSSFEEKRWIEIRTNRRRKIVSVRTAIHRSKAQSRQALSFWKRLEQQAAGLTAGKITGLSSQRLPQMAQPKTRG